MASASSVSTSKIFGTKANTVVIDEWTEWEPKKAEPVYLEYNTPPLALVISMQEAGKQSHEIYETLVGAGKMHGRIDIIPVISTEHQKQAATIYDYFAKKHTMRRIKGEYVSKYMLALDDLCENRKRIDLESVKILVSLPRIYNQNRELESVMKGRKSAKKLETISFARWKGEIEFIKRVHVKTSRWNEYHYYYSTPKNHVMRVVVKKGEYGQNAWDTLSKLGKLHINADVVYTYNIKGYDFNVLQFSPEHTEINIK